MKRMMVTATLLVLLCAGLNGYVFLGDVWPDGSIVMQLQLGSSGTLRDGSTSWGQSAEGALASWNAYLGRVQFRVVRDSTAATGDGNGSNNVFWSSAVYSRPFGSNVLAVTTHWLRGSTRTEADVIFNTAYSWNSYTGPILPSNAGGSLNDIRRVALHEFGHALGLNHPDEAGQSQNAIMVSHESDTYTLQPDDIAGVGVLYGGSSPSATAPGAPSGLAASASGSTVFLSWQAPGTGGTPTTYYIEAGSTVGAVNLANFSTGSTARSFSSGGIGAGVYYVRVRAGNAIGISGTSNEATMIVGGGCSAAPGAPGALIGSSTGSTVNLAWSASSGNPTTYIVEAGSAPGLSNLANSDLGSTTTSLVAPNIGSGTYYVRVRGKNSCGVGAVSNEVVVIVR